MVHLYRMLLIQDVIEKYYQQRNVFIRLRFYSRILKRGELLEKKKKIKTRYVCHLFSQVYKVRNDGNELKTK